MIDPLSGFPANAKIEPSAKQLLGRLSPQVPTMIRELLEVMERAARANSVPISKTELVANRDPEEGTERVEIRQWVRVPDDKIMDVWDKMGQEIDRWINALPDLEAEELTESVAFAVYSDANDVAA